MKWVNNLEHAFATLICRSNAAMCMSDLPSLKTSWLKHVQIGMMITLRTCIKYGQC